jgi:hypothetical protein
MTGILFFFAAVRSYSIGERVVAGGRSVAMGGCSVSVVDFWSVSNNPAGTAWLKTISTGIYFENRFLIKTLLYEELGFVLPVKAGTFGFVLSHSGIARFSEIKAGISYARKFGNYFSVGISVDYLRLNLPDEYGGKNLISCEFGLMYIPNKRLNLGIHIVNPVPIKITTHPVELLPTTVCLGVTYHFSDTFLVTIEAEKDLIHLPVFRVGAEYHFASSVYARLGVSTNPAKFAFGFGLEFGHFKIDLASEYHQVLGFSPSGSINYCF